MSDYRRRRIDPEEPKGNGGLPIVPLIVLVVFAGLLLGGVLAQFLGRGNKAAVPTPMPTVTLAVATPPSYSPSPQPTASPAATAKPTPSATPSVKPSAVASATPTHAPTATPSPRPSAASTPTATPAIIITPAPKATAKPAAKPTERPTERPTPPPPTATPAPSPALITGAATADHAAAIVRSYLTALANGESSFATGYLRRGLPSEDFMKGGHVSSVQATSNGDGSFFVTAAMQTPAGSFTENFRLENGPNGLQITDHSPTVSH